MLNIGPDLIFTVRKDGLVQDVHAPRDNELAASAREAVGKSAAKSAARTAKPAAKTAARTGAAAARKPATAKAAAARGKSKG